MDELENSLLELASDACKQVEQNEHQEEQSIIDRIIIYIDEHYMNHTLSLDTVAFEFGISPSHASRTFKEKLGINFVQYVWQKRMEEVQSQLKSTNDSIKNIITNVGYMDAPNFIRKFKKRQATRQVSIANSSHPAIIQTHQIATWIANNDESQHPVSQPGAVGFIFFTKSDSMEPLLYFLELS
ncbi:AraC family transcriptional regulator [Paenibacillus sp. D2_2]|uniref:helix-turn-helix transcriptional regulator n=1 Tax=Paenibacillus sp. D2_2 TaxID=3073092 RepID=UPI002815D8CB|nr:AraC family transcriptional regulator [Paenibacillus sp. D2_2]WMT39467.1 AraC family transcriptional regulator [Paenibacillus sp. D2_2]